MNGLQIGIIHRAVEYEHLLSTWEQEFIENMLERDESYELSEAQNDVLNRIESKIARERRVR